MNQQEWVQEADEPEKMTKKEKEEEQRRQQLFHLGRKVGASFNIRALDAWPLKSSSKVYVLTGSHFLVINPKNITNVSLFKWSSLKTFNIPENKKVILLAFKEEKKLASAEGYTVRTDKFEFDLTFEKDYFENASSNMVDAIQRVLTPGELEKLSFSQLKAPAVATTAKTALCRFKMGSQGKPSRFSQKTIQRMIQIIQVGEPHIDLSQFDAAAKLMPTFLDCIPFIHTLKSVEIPQTSKIEVFPYIARLFKQKSSLKSITIDGKCKCKDLTPIVEAIKANSSLKLRGIEFSLSSFTTRELNVLLDLLSHKNINTLGFHDAFQSPQEVGFFYNSILDPSITQNLYCLNLSKTYNLDIESLFPKLSKIRFLSLAYCDLEIIDVFSKLSLIAMPRLTEIDLSGNKVSFDKYLDENTKLPQYLTSLILNNMSWPVDSFRLFIYQIFKHINDNLKLSLSNTIMEENEWYKVFASLENQKENGSFTGLSVLIWDYNPLHKKLFSFLKRNKRLTRLQMNYCFRSADDAEVFNKLKDYLAGARNLKTIIIRGNEDNNFGKNTPKLVEVFKSMPNLQQLDISDSHGGNESLRQIEELCTKNKALKINFDGLYPTDFQEYTEYYTRLVSIRPPPASGSLDVNTNPIAVNQPSLLRISFPFNDILYLVNSDKVSDRDFRHFQNLFFYSPEEEKNRIIKIQELNQNNTSRFKPIYDGELSQPGNLYKLFADDDFPRYIDEDVVKQFKKDVQTISINGNPDYEDENINDMAFKSMLLNSRRFSSLRTSSTNIDSTSPTPSPTPYSRQVNNQSDDDDETSSGSEDVNESDLNMSDDSNDSNERAPRTPTHARVNQNDSDEDDNKPLSDTESSPTPNNFQERNINGADSQSDNEDEDEENDDNNDDELNFEIPQFIDVSRYNYSGWKALDKEFTLQNMYSRMTQNKRSSELASIRSHKGKK